MNRNLVGVGVLGAALAGLGAACGGGSSAATTFFGQFCDIYRPCCAAAGLRSDGQQCRALYGAIGPSAGYDPVAGEACLAAMRDAAAMPGFCEGQIEDPEVCGRVFPSSGSKAPGTTCTSDTECARSDQGTVSCASAFTSAGAQISKCQVEIRGVAGSTPCIWTVDGSSKYSSSNSQDVIPQGYGCHVSDGLRCDSATGACVTLAPVGGGCSSDAACVSGAYCDFAAGTCAARKAVGGTCTGSDTQCVATAFCSSTALTCSAHLDKGAACSADGECTSGSCVNALCAAGSANFTLQFLCGSS